MAGAVVAAVVYGSLLPFDFEWATPVRANGGALGALLAALGSPTWVAGDRGTSPLGMSYAMSDLLMNVLLYLPLGVTLRMAIRASVKSWPIEVFGTMAIAFALSWCVESLQGLMPSRVASLNDVALNTASALLAALLGLWFWTVYKRLAFGCYCKLIGLFDRLRAAGERPGVVMAIAAINALVIGLWFLGEVRRSFTPDDAGAVLPFERLFALPYDLGAVLMGRAMLAYAVIGCLLLLLTYTGTRRVAMRWVVLGVVLLAFAAELSRALTQGTMPDVTGPLLALAAGAIMTVTVYTFSLAVRRSNRRHLDLDYDGPDRRRRPHDYA